ncbi:PREDICTED: immunoglobulin superfamily member 10 [Miniopterus natalensis]|uniref:immunoglobulin superfamily member 10 n=1 Tax=Miniopterus natalensis TaxID=291302 RepID=UPI0007A706A4|nr:PREDICTED: immunoglobulin superfamily member 10 [Miniopterus natalensis]
MKVKGGGIACALVPVAVICLVATPGDSTCPRRCACYVPTEVHCTFRYLTSIPDSIPPEVERVNLGYNSLVRLTEADFAGLSKLELLMLHSNGIHTIPAKTFSDLQALQVLKMSYNKVRKLQKDSFYGLRSLTRLHMDHNNIEFINPEAFYGLTFLRLVHLEGNRLTKLHPDTFVSLRYLQIFKTSFIKYLYLSDNFLSSLPQEMVSYMPDLESLYLHGNPWTCDCHLKWLSDWMQEKPDIIKCKKDRSPSNSQQCPLCMNPRTSKGKPLATVPAAAFLCVKPTIDPSLKLKSLTFLEDSSSVSISPQNFMAPFGSLILNMTDQSGNEANVVCSVQKPSRTSSIAFTEDNDYIRLNTSFSTFLMCNIDYSHIQPVWQILALYSDSPLILERSHLLTETPQLCYQYKQVAPKPEDIFTNIEAALRADPPWLMQDQISLQLNRTATTLSTLQVQYSSDAHVTVSRSEVGPVGHKWTLIPRDNNTKLERTVLVGGTIDLDCPGQGDPAPHLEWLLADGSKVRAPYVSEDGRILIDKSGKLELQMADSSDTGIYGCISTNDADADVLAYRVTVVEPHVEPRQENGAHHTVFLGEALDLPCRSTGVPDASVSWVLPGNTVLSQSSGEKQILNGTLRILRVTQRDQGHYRCVAANPSGVDVLINQVSVQTKGPSSVEHHVESDGSGLAEHDPTVHPKDPPAVPPLTSAPTGAEAGEQALSTGKTPSHRELRHRRRGNAASRPLRGHRRQLPPSARRIDPRRWAALLEKAKKKAVPQKQETSAAGPPAPATQPLSVPGEEADASGLLPPEEEFMVLATKVPSVRARTGPAGSQRAPDGPETAVSAGAEVSPMVSPHALPPEKPTDFKLPTVKTAAMSRSINPTASSKMQDTTTRSVPTAFPLPEAAPPQDASDSGRGERLQSAPPTAVGAAIEGIGATGPGSANSKAGTLLGSESAPRGQQTPETGGSESRSGRFYSQRTQRLSALRLPPGPYSAAPARLQAPRNGTTRTPLSSRFGRRGRPALTTLTPPNSPSAPLWSENHFWPKSFPETAPRGRRPGASTPPPPGPAEDPTRASNRDAQGAAEQGGLDGTPAQKVTASELPLEPLPGDVFERPRVAGGSAASFTVPAGADALLACAAVGNPLPTVRWTRGSSGLDLSARTQNSRFQVLPNGTLSIRRVDIQDRGQYLCSASNPLGKAHLHVTLSVISYPPRILERHTKEITAHSGSTVELPCRAEGRPAPTISWALANLTVVSESSEGNGRALVTSDGTLVLHSVSVYDRGFYKCMASNSAGQDSLLVKVQVIAAPPVILEQKRQVVAGTWGASLKLPCTATGTPRPSVRWVLSDGTEVKPLQSVAPNLFLFPNGTLYIRNVASSDRGTYECIATSSTGSDRRVVILTMAERETIPRIEFASQTWNEVNFGDKLLLNCSAVGEPKPKIIWRLPSKAVVDQWHRMGSRIHVYPNGSLFIGSITEKDGGDYVCVARNKIGDDLILMHVSLKLKPAKIDHRQHLKTQVFHGKDFQVDCKASGSPVPQISWSLPDGTTVHATQAGGRRSRRYTLFDNGTLYFNKVGIAEEGDYTCYAQNPLGRDEMKVHLTVITAAPRIRQGFKATTRVRAGDTAVLDCEVVGEPKPKVFWLLPSSDLISSSKDRYTFHANGSLSVNDVKLLDSGEYVCVARNPSGDDTKMYKLDVVPRPPVINGLYTNKTVIQATAVRHSKKHFNCRAEGTPPPHVTWIMPDNILLPAPYHGSRVTVHRNGTLEIRNVRRSDSAEFTCVARNAGGESVLVVRLEVLEMLRRPTFRNPFNEKIVAQLGKSTALNCSVDGNPPPEIVWMLPNGTRFPKGPQNPQYLIASNGSFMIYKATREDAGKYRCGARNKVGYIEKLIVLEIGQKPVILTNALGTVYGISGDSLALHCVSDGSPKPNIKWTVPSGHTLDRPQISGKYILHENGTLVIKEATAYDRGNYICKAQNSIGHALVTVPVVVVAYPPRITTRPPRNILARTGAAVRLHCVALGVPTPEVTWEMPDHSLLSVADKARPCGTGLFHPQGTLVIQNPQTSDSGMYRCTAKNALGSDFATTYMQVI